MLGYVFFNIIGKSNKSESSCPKKRYVRNMDKIGLMSCKVYT